MKNNNVTAAMMVSVMLQTYNRVFVLMKSLENVLTQTFQDFEVIIVAMPPVIIPRL